MNDAATLRQQMATSTDPDRLEREALRVDLEEAKRHIEALTAFFMDNVNWVRASNEARAFLRRLPDSAKLTVDEMVALTEAGMKADLGAPDPSFAGVSG